MAEVTTIVFRCVGREFEDALRALSRVAIDDPAALQELLQRHDALPLGTVEIDRALCSVGVVALRLWPSPMVAEFLAEYDEAVPAAQVMDRAAIEAQVAANAAIAVAAARAAPIPCAARQGSRPPAPGCGPRRCVVRSACRAWFRWLGRLLVRGRD